MTRIHRRLFNARLRWPQVVAGLVLVGMGAGVWQGPQWMASADVESSQPAALTQPGSRQVPSGRSCAEHLQIRVVQPSEGGLMRRIVQTGSIEAFESADVYAKVSGYLRSIGVDIGTPVEAGQVLAELDVPELVQELKRRKSLLEQARGEARQADARLKIIQAEQETAVAVVSEAEARIQRHVLEGELFQKEAGRLQQVVRQGAVQEQLLDEKLHRLKIAKAAEEQARNAVRVARARWTESSPRVELARAESVTAHAAVQVAEADVEHAEIQLRYSRIVSPFTGVVTQRNVHPGAFVRSAAEGGHQPLFKVSRTDQMKVVVAVPDRFVPYIKPHDRAEVRVDALHGGVFEGAVARIARFQDRKTRTMRVEIDLPNPEGQLIDGMYGSVMIVSPPPSESLTVPTASLASGTENGRGLLYVVRAGQLRKLPVWIGQNNGIRAEVLSGLDADDVVVAEATESLRLEEGQLADIRLEVNSEDSLAGTTDPARSRP